MAISYLPKSSPCRPGFHDSVIENIFPIYIFKAVNQQKQEGCENNTWITLQRGESSVVDVSYSLSSSLSPLRESCKTWTSWMVLFLFPGLSGRERERVVSVCLFQASSAGSGDWGVSSLHYVRSGGDYVNMWLCTCNNNCRPVHTQRHTPRSYILAR